MSGWIYLIRNRDLYKIGITKNICNRMRQLKPDNIVAKLYTNDFVELERELHKRYKKYRIPQTEYFRLKDYHIREIKHRISKLNYPMSMILWIFIRSLLLILLIFFLIFIVLYLNINDLNKVILKSISYIEGISIGLSIFSIFFNSSKSLSFISELKYRLLCSITFSLFALIFRISNIFFQYN